MIQQLKRLKNERKKEKQRLLRQVLNKLKGTSFLSELKVIKNEKIKY